MKTLTLLIELTYDDDSFHSGDTDPEAKEWFFNAVMRDQLLLHSNEVGDTVGTVRVLSIEMGDSPSVSGAKTRDSNAPPRAG